MADTGGGTAFWPEAQTATHMSADAVAAAIVPGTEVVVRPAVGDALLWGPHLAHAGVAVEHGTRHILVASFSLSDAHADDLCRETLGCG